MLGLWMGRASLFMDLEAFINIIEKYMVTSTCHNIQLAAFLRGYINGLWNAGAITLEEWRFLMREYITPITQKGMQEINET